MHDVLGLGLQIVLQLPTLLVLLVGVIVAMTAMRRDRRRAALAAAGFGALLVGSALSVVLAIMPWIMHAGGMSVSELSGLTMVLALVVFLVGLAGWVCVILALLIRSSAAPPPVAAPFGGADPHTGTGGLS